MGFAVHRFLGVVLVAAAALKSMPGWPAHEVGVLFGNRWLAALEIVVESLLGVWLIIGCRPAEARWAAMATFLSFSFVAGAKSFRGEQSCGCLGQTVAINPWVALAFDLFALWALWRWPVQTSGTVDRPRPAPARSIACVFFGLGTTALTLSAYAGLELVDSLAPNGIEIKGPTRLEVKHSDRRQPLEVAFRLYNPSGREITIEKIQTDCPRATAEFPVTALPPGQEGFLLVRVTSFDEAETAFRHRVRVDTDAGRVTVLVEGTLPAAQTVFFRPHALFLQRDEHGQWPTRSIKVRVPRLFDQSLSEDCVSLTDCGQSRASIVKTGQTEHHNEYTVRLVPSQRIGADWRGGTISVRTGCGNLSIPIHADPSAGKAGGT